MRIHPSITIERVEAAARSQMFGTDNPGFCIACGEDAEGCEPDARKYPCDACGELAVYGAQELLFFVLGTIGDKVRAQSDDQHEKDQREEEQREENQRA